MRSGPNPASPPHWSASIDLHCSADLWYDGATALHALRRERPDLVVLDLMLRDRDGWDVTRTVRSDPALAATPIIMVTARIEDTDRIVGLELGADDYVTKPFNPRDHAFTRAELIEQALGYSCEGLDRTVDSHIKNLRRKIEPDPANPILIQTVYGVGYRLRREEAA